MPLFGKKKDKPDLKDVGKGGSLKLTISAPVAVTKAPTAAAVSAPVPAGGASGAPANKPAEPDTHDPPRCHVATTAFAPTNADELEFKVRALCAVVCCIYF
jgi:hypothetical protein